MKFLGEFKLQMNYNQSCSSKHFFALVYSRYDNKLNKLLTKASKAPYLLRNHRHFALPKWKTDRFKNTFILSSCLKYN